MSGSKKILSEIKWRKYAGHGDGRTDKQEFTGVAAITEELHGLFSSLVNVTEALVPPLTFHAAFEKGKQSLPKNKTGPGAKTKMETRAMTNKNMTSEEQSNKMLKIGQERPSLASHRASRSQIEDLRI